MGFLRLFKPCPIYFLVRLLTCNSVLHFNDIIYKLPSHRHDKTPGRNTLGVGEFLLAHSVRVPQTMMAGKTQVELAPPLLVEL